MARTAAAKAEPKPRTAKAAIPADPLSTVSNFVHGGLAANLGTEHQRQIRLVIGESAELTDAAKQRSAIAAIAKVADAESYSRVGQLLIDVGKRRKEVETFFKPIKDLAYKLHRMICDRENDILRPVKLFEELASANWSRFEREEAQRKRDEEARLSEQARQQEQAHLLQEAENLANRGDVALAEAVRQQAETLPAPVISVADNLPEIQGLSSRENWTWRPVGGDTPENRARMRLMLPRDYMAEDEKKLLAYAKAHKASGRIPGIEIYDAGGVTRR
jgi:hypothetical protein